MYSRPFFKYTQRSLKKHALATISLSHVFKTSIAKSSSMPTMTMQSVRSFSSHSNNHNNDHTDQNNFNELITPDRMLFIKAGILLGMGVAVACVVEYLRQHLKSNEEKQLKIDPNSDICLLDGKDFHPFVLKAKKTYNHDTAVYHFYSHPANADLEFPVSGYVLIKIDGPDGKPIIRPYTPLSSDLSKELQILIKTYPQGNISKYVSTLKHGDTIYIKGPMKKLQYTPNMKDHISFVAGGSGITPCLQLIETIMSNPNDHTKVTLLFANRTSDDILLKERLEKIKAFHPDRLNIVYFVDQQKLGWTGEVGLITKDKLKKHLPPPSDSSLVYVCGPPRMYESISGPKAKDFTQGEVGGALKELGYTKDQVYKF
jgi:cytochrome-b5 reductase